MIATPYEDPKDKTIPKQRKNVEIIDLTDTTFKYSFNEERLEKTAQFSLFGGLLQNHPFIGGLVNGPETPLQNCIIIKQPKKTTYPLLEPRNYASSIVLNQKTLWLTGGIGKSSTEFVSVDEPTIKGPNFPFNIYGHAMVQIDQKTIYVIGGHHNHKDQKKTWIVDPNNVDESDQLILQKGPKMKHRRVYHCSSKMKLGEKVILVTVGGSCFSSHSSRFHGLCLTKSSSETLQNLPYFIYV